MFRLFALIGCAFGRHAREEHVHWDGFNYQSQCKWCGAKVFRRAQGTWKRDRKREDNDKS